MGKNTEETWFSCKLMLYEMFHCVVWLRFTIVFEELAGSIFQEEHFFFLTVGGPQSPP